MSDEMGIRFQSGTVYKQAFGAELVSYELKEDNPAHCLQIFFGESCHGMVCIYPDQITVLPQGKDGFTVKFQKPIPWNLEPRVARLPDPSMIGRTYRKKSTIQAVKMDKDFEVRTLEGVMKGKAGDYLAKGIKGELYPIAAKIFEESYEEDQK